MASEIRVNKIENRSGLGTVTFADTGVDLAGIVTATTFSGSGASLTNLPAANVTGTLPAISGANLTNLPAANLTGTLPAISGANLTGIAATDNVRTGILDVAGISTFRNTMNVGAAVTISESGIEATGVGITVANINGGQVGGRRNLVINGAMQVAQRGTSSTSVGYVTLDRFNTDYGGENEAMTYTQADVSSGTTPYTEGFRKTFKVQNGNQTGGAGSGDYVFVRTKIEAQDLANSGWNYVSSSSFITLSFWVKSSVAQTFYGRLESVDGTARNFPYSYAVSADTWTKVVKTIPGNTSPTIDIDNNNGSGMELHWDMFRGSNFSDSGVSLDTWATYASGTRTPSQTSTWWTTNDATWELTGVQLEVGSQATAFEHRSFAEEALLCKRYYQVIKGNSDLVMFGSGRASGTDTALVATQLAVPLRASPTIASVNYSAWGVSGSKSVSSGSPTVQSFNATDNQLNMQFGGLAGQMTNARPAVIACDSGSNLTMDAEL
jgi:hypothetical protein